MGRRRKSRPSAIADLHHRISIRSDAGTTDADDYDAESWTEISGGAVYAQITASKGGEKWEADQRMPVTTHKIKVRWRTDVETKMRVYATLDGVARIWVIEGISNDEGERMDTFLILEAMELPAQ